MCPTTNFTDIFCSNWTSLSNNLQNYLCNRKDLIRLSEGHNLEERGGGWLHHSFSEASLSGVEAFQEFTQTSPIFSLYRYNETYGRIILLYPLFKLGAQNIVRRKKTI